MPATREDTVPAGAEEALPPVESLTPDSDFSPFMSGGVDESVKRRALKTLFADPRFNAMDGLDVYIDDYSKPDPLPEGWLEKLNQVARLGEYKEPEKIADAAQEPQEHEETTPASTASTDAKDVPPDPSPAAE